MLAELTPDNTHLSRPNSDPDWPRAINCTDHLTDRVADLVEASLAENTRRAYRADLDHFP